MSIIIVTYDLNDLTRDYTPFFTAIQNQGVWWHNLRTTWLIDTAKTRRKFTKPCAILLQ